MRELKEYLGEKYIAEDELVNVSKGQKAKKRIQDAIKKVFTSADFGVSIGRLKDSPIEYVSFAFTSPDGKIDVGYHYENNDDDQKVVELELNPYGSGVRGQAIKASIIEKLIKIANDTSFNFGDDTIKVKYDRNFGISIHAGEYH